jgi:hypothetical protein
MQPRRAAALGIAAVLLVWLGQFLTVRYNYGGNWTGLFCIAPHMPVPDFLKTERLYVFQNSQGYDGQIYHLIAHDPWMRRGSADAILSPTFRYQRILVPALAWCFALGVDTWIHRSYFAVILVFVYLGVYWLSRIAARTGVSPCWGLVFVLAPATLISLDRMTVDIALAALTCGLVLYDAEGPAWKVTAVLVCAGLTRETALLMVAAYAFFLVTRRRFHEAAWAAAAALPALGWFAYLAHARPEPSELSVVLDWAPLAGLLDALRHPTSYPLVPWKNALTVIFDYVAHAGIIAALVLSIRMALKRRWSAQVAMIYSLALPGLFIRSGAFWPDAYAYGRPFTPLILLVALESLERPWLALLPMFLLDSRIGVNLAPQILGVFHGVTGR